ncbi:peptide/nickel transport system substrate-binding protein [Enhydrobacter aerosaccus]|uniref:Peptide/nickel transport system substrate-binding protein n=1 Tax=Enhydrobacter aerosaccus TaxID=225324 RepID=A0A1T4TG33_9HYPH|nr:ABC transporter substrate-binding protein [Enhydrobacter aerosaccus]SKA39179.1 peptide/nickel transport system substrate-binding protein [Enhydrobacter aerosaccus]
MRRFLMSVAAALAVTAGPVAASAETVLKVVMQSDVKAVDPIWSGAYITRGFGYMIYDTLFSMDAKFQVKPQMVDTWSTSDDGLTWTFKLRDGLEWHDGTPVTSEDCIASLKRWSARDSMGQKLAAVLAEYKAVDDKTFQIVLKERFGPLLSAIGKPSVIVPFMMPKKVAETDPFKQIDSTIGSGPFILKRDEWKPGEKMVFVKNPKYKPRAESISGMAGGKVVNLDRVEWVWIPDPETQVNALVKGEIDAIESLDFDHASELEKTKGVKVLKSTVVNQYVFRLNWLQPPFNNEKIRQAVAFALSQPEFLEANVGDKRYYRVCKAMFTCDSPYATTAGMDGLIEGNVAKAKQLLAQAGYDGTPIVVPQPTDLGVIKQLAPVAKAQLERAGFKVDIQPTDWQTMIGRLANKGPTSQGGWNAFGTSWQQIDILDPLMTPYLVATCDKARPGWPCDAEIEKIRDKFIQATTDAERKAAAEEAQTRAMKVVTHIPLGEWNSLSAARDNVVFPDPLPPMFVFWGVSKK